MAKTQLEPCPFCDGTNITYERMPTISYFQCEDCGCMGPTVVLIVAHRPKATAASAWNTRINRPAPSGAPPAYVTPIKRLRH